MRILVVDDEPDLVDYVETVLREAFPRAEIEVSFNGAHALLLCHGSVFNIILTDFQMPIMNGLEFTQFLRLKPGPNQNTPIVFISGFVDTFKVDAEVIENLYFVHKPPQIERLIRITSIAAGEPLKDNY